SRSVWGGGAALAAPAVSRQAAIAPSVRTVFRTVPPRRLPRTDRRLAGAVRCRLPERRQTNRLLGSLRGENPRNAGAPHPWFARFADGKAASSSLLQEESDAAARASLVKSACVGMPIGFASSPCPTARPHP